MRLLKILLVIAAFVLYYIGFLHFGTVKRALDLVTHFGLASYVITYFIVGIPLFLATWVLDFKANIFRNLGLSSNVLSAFWIALLFALPMLTGGYFLFGFKKITNFEQLIAGTICAGFFEELYFRGFLFGQLFKKIKIGFVPAIVFGALIFASGHLYQSRDFASALGIFSITFLGAILFAWLFAEWDFNLWIPIFLHTFMNLAWEIFAMDNNALGGFGANLLRFSTVALAIVFTIIRKKSKGQKLAVNRKTLWKLS